MSKPARALLAKRREAAGSAWVIIIYALFVWIVSSFYKMIVEHSVSTILVFFVALSVSNLLTDGLFTTRGMRELWIRFRGWRKRRRARALRAEAKKTGIRVDVAGDDLTSKLAELEGRWSEREKMLAKMESNDQRIQELEAEVGLDNDSLNTVPAETAAKKLT